MNNFIAAFTGALISLMIAINGSLSAAIGNYKSSVLIHIVGLISIVLLLKISKEKFTIKRGIPLYLYSAGAIGVFTVLFNNLSFQSLGVSLTLSLGLLGESIASIFIDNFGLLGMKTRKFEKKKIFGLILIVLGITIMAFF